MAIKVRRGNYDDLDTSKLVQGEPFLTLDKVASGGVEDYYAGIAIAPSNVIRLATWADLTDIRETCVESRDEAVESASNAATSESNSEAWAVGERGGVPVSSGDDTYNNNSKYYSEQSGTYWQYVHDAVDLVVPSVSINFTTGELEITGTTLYFTINQSTGQLEWDVSHS